jgi:hypothetical protein
MKLCRFGIHSWKEHSSPAKLDESMAAICMAATGLFGAPYGLYTIGEFLESNASTWATIPLVILLCILIVSLFVSSICLCLMAEGHLYTFIYNKTCVNCHQSNFAAEEVAAGAGDDKAEKRAQKKKRLKQEKEEAAEKAFKKNLKRYKQAKEKAR